MLARSLRRRPSKCSYTVCTEIPSCKPISFALSPCASALNTPMSRSPSWTAEGCGDLIGFTLAFLATGTNFNAWALRTNRVTSTSDLVHLLGHFSRLHHSASWVSTKCQIRASAVGMSLCVMHLGRAHSICSPLTRRDKYLPGDRRRGWRQIPGLTARNTGRVDLMRTWRSSWSSPGLGLCPASCRKVVG